MIKLTITEKGGEPRALSFDQNEVSIGRVQGNDIVLPKGNISKRHSKLTLVDGRMTVADVKSTNGTYVNGKKIGEATSVRPGDKIFVGDFLIVVDPAAASAEISSTGSRRGPPPPPPPPPRPGLARAAAPVEAAEGDDSGGAFGSHGDHGPATGRSNPPAPPPPPPPRRTIMTTSLQDDSVDIGIDDAPPSPDDVSTDDAVGGRDAASDALASLTSDMEDDGMETGMDDGAPQAAAGDGGSDVFGFQPAPDEDARPRGDSGPPAPRAPDDDDDARPTGAASTGWSRATAAPDVTAAGAAGTLEGLLGDTTVTSIFINTGGSVQVERAGKVEPAGPLGDGNSIAEAVWQLANTAVPPPAADNPVVDVRLPDGTRVTALFPPIAATSVTASIRRPATPEASLADIAGSGDVEKILTAAVMSRRNLLLCGDAPGIAALAGALAATFPAERRIVNVGVGVGAKSRPGWIDLALAGDPAELVRAAVAFRADHLLVAEAGGAEWPELLLAAARGQEGVMGALAARSTAEALTRLRAFCVQSIGAAALPALVASTVDLVVLAGTTAAGTVRVLEIAEPHPEGDGSPPTLVAHRPEKSRTTTTLDISGVSPRLAASIAVAADTLPAHLVRR